MPNPIKKAVTLLAFTTLSALSSLSVAADEDDPPARVGRVAVAQGQVSIAADVGAELAPAQVNWPVTTGSMLTTAPGARTEVQVGSTSIRLDGDSSLEVLQLDDDTMRLRLHYGSASIRVVNQDVLAGFELETPQARVRLEQPGRVRVDAERQRDTSFVTVFDGAALVDAGGSQLSVRAGRRAELGDVDVRTLAAAGDGFDDWALARDRAQDSAVSARYVTTEMTGYEDLDRNGSWSDNADYGPLWYPSVASTWVPYRDGSWTWLDPWGWTWVDNASWGYAPFHYGRWVQVSNRWAWAPGRRVPGIRHERPVWAPALVGWVGGAGWNVAFRDRTRHPAQGWYPLTPHDRFTPTWRASPARVAWLNSHVRPGPRRPGDYRPPGLTVVPQDRFGRPGRVDVPRTPIATVPPVFVHNAPGAAPPAPPNRPPRANPRPDRGDWDRDPGRGGGRGRIETAGGGRGDRDGRDGRGDGFVRPGAGQVAQVGGPGRAPGLVAPATPVRPQPIVSPTPHQSPQPLTGLTPSQQQGVPEQFQAPGRPGNWRDRDRDGDGQPDRFERNNGNNGNNWGRERRDGAEDWRRNRPAPVQAAPQAAPVQPAQMPSVPRFERPEARSDARTDARPERQHRGEWGGGAQRGAPAAMPAAPPAPAPAPVAAPRQMPAPQSAPAQQARGGGEERRQHADGRGRNQQER
jgi:hypothetical protein